MLVRFALAAAAVLLPVAGWGAPKPPASLRLYVFDCGRLKVEDPVRFDFKKEELAELDLSVGCYLVVHPKGTLMWDTGVIPDAMFKPGVPATLDYAISTKPLLPQLAKVGYTPADITYLALSHYHWDHVGNANAFAGSLWLARKAEHELMFAQPPPRTEPARYSALKNAKTQLIGDGDYDVFGDGTVVMKFTPGHTEGHQVLYLKLAKTGPIVLSGDLYHYPEELKVHRAPVRDINKQQTFESRDKLQAFLKQSGAQLWIQHDLRGFQKLKKAPEYYD